MHPVAVCGIFGGMSTTPNKPTHTACARKAIGRLLEAVDNVVVATEEVKLARAALAREAKRLPAKSRKESRHAE